MLDTVTEHWRPIPGAEGFYRVSDQGRIRSERLPHKTVGRQRGRVLKPCPDNKGYLLFRICIPGRPPKTMKVHRAVALAFLGPAPEGLQINHKNGDKRDNRVENLEYISCRENIRHCWQMGLHGVAHTRGETNVSSKLREADVLAIRAQYPSMSYAQLARKYRVTLQNIYSIVKRQTWRHV
jgi:hypothetical protein